MGIKRIDKKSFPYLLLKNFVGFWHNHVFYQRIVIQNQELVPKNAHLIFTGNHQNALMDALVFLYGVKGRLVFMARSDIFKNPYLAAILYFFRMLPVFRIKDGYSEVKKNDKTFLKTIDVIKKNIGIVIMAEGNHGSERRLRPLKKGFARIAFQTEEANDFKLNMQVVPVGIDYSDYGDYRTELLINYGKPILVSDYYEAYKESPAIAINQIKDKLAESMKPLMVHIKSEKHYELYNELREIYKYDLAQKMDLSSANQPYKLQADQELIKRLEIFEESHSEEEMDAFQKLVIRYRDTVDRHKLSYSVVRKKTCSSIQLFGESLLFLLASPVFLLGWLLNYIPFGFSFWVERKFKDPQFKSSVKFVVSMFIWPLFHFLETLFVWLIFKDWTIALGFYIAMPILGILARAYWVSFNQFLKAWRWSKLKRKNLEDYRSINNDQQEIFNRIKTIVG